MKGGSRFGAHAEPFLRESSICCSGLLGSVFARRLADGGFFKPRKMLARPSRATVRYSSAKEEYSSAAKSFGLKSDTSDVCVSPSHLDCFWQDSIARTRMECLSNLNLFLYLFFTHFCYDVLTSVGTFFIVARRPRSSGPRSSERKFAPLQKRQALYFWRPDVRRGYSFSTSHASQNDGAS